MFTYLLVLFSFSYYSGRVVQLCRDPSVDCKVFMVWIMMWVCDEVDLLKLEFQMAMSHHMGTGNGTRSSPRATSTYYLIASDLCYSVMTLT